MKNHTSRWLLLGATLATTGLALAQNGNGNRPNWGNMTPEQRQQMQAQRQQQQDQQREGQLRGAMTSIGEAVPAQDAVVAFVKAQNAAAMALTPKIDAMRAAFGKNADDAAVSAALVDYKSAVEAARKTREDQIGELDKQISFSTKPKLEALLTMMGIIGDETSFVANLSGNARLPGAGGRGGGRGGNGGNNRGGGAGAGNGAGGGAGAANGVGAGAGNGAGAGGADGLAPNND